MNRKKAITTFRSILGLKPYSPNTIKNYVSHIQKFIYSVDCDNPELISDKQILRYLDHLVNEKEISFSYQKGLVGALNLFYNEVFNRSIPIQYIRPVRNTKYIPTILSKQELLKMLQYKKNIKHKSLIATIYSAGLRSGELINMVLKDIDFDRNVMKIRKSKNNKDRIVPLSNKLIIVLRKYFVQYRLKQYLFEGQKGGKYSRSSLQNVVKKAAKRAGIKKPITTHSLRHSYATYLLESGTDIRYIQELLGHNSLRTTQIYTQVSKAKFKELKSPLDSL